MPFVIPNEADAGFADQAEPDKVDLDILAAGFGLSGVISGCAVTAQGSPDMTVAVAAGTVSVKGLLAAVTAGNVTITAADGTNPRFDLIAIDKAGAKSRVGGTAAANPVFPAIPADSVIVAAVYVPASDTDIDANQITDKRVMVTGIPARVRSGQGWYYVQTGALTTGAPGVNTLEASALWLPGGITLDRIGIEVTALIASGTARLGIYRDSGFGYPGARLLDAGTVVTTANGVVNATISQAITEPDWYWVVTVNQVAAATLRRIGFNTIGGPLNQGTFFTTAPGNNVPIAYSVAGVSGALPDPFGTAPLTIGNVATRVHVRVA